MTFMHMDAVSAASASQAIVSLQNVTVSEFDFPSAVAKIQFFGDGQVWEDNSGQNFLYFWIDPADSTILPGVDPYQIRRSNTQFDEPSGPNDGVWTEIVTKTSLALPTTLNGGTGYGNGQLLTVLGGVVGIGGNAATFTTQNVAGGVIPFSQGLALTDAGKYFTAPNGARGLTTVFYSGGTGSGVESYARFDAIQWTLGAGYPNDAFSVFDVSIRKGTGPVLATAQVTLDVDAS